MVYATSSSAKNKQVKANTPNNDNAIHTTKTTILITHSCLAILTAVPPTPGTMVNERRMKTRRGAALRGYKGEMAGPS